MGKKFMGLGGTDHFWDRAKAWILNQITSAVAAKIAEVVANAPEDLDTLKEIADWIKNHANDAAAMNTQITENKSNIATNTSDISALKTSVAGKADKVHTHSAGDITSGTLPIANGGTGATDAADGFNTLADGVRDSSTPKDDEKMLLKPTGTWYKTTCLDFWNYIKGKISSVLGLTKDNYGGTAASILDYNKGTPIKVRWGGAGINSAEWYPAFNADGSAIEPISRANIHVGNAGNADTVDNYHASDLWRKDGGTWNPNANISLGATANGDEWSFDISRNGHTGCYWHVWDSSHGSLLKVDADDGRVTALKGLKANSKMVIPIGAPSSLEDGCIWIER